MTIIQQLNQLREERDQAQQKVLQMEVDILTTIKAIQEAIELLGVPEQLNNIKQSNGTINIGTVMMKMLPKLLTQKLPKERLGELYNEVMPVLAKYNYLYQETKKPQTTQPTQQQKQMSKPRSLKLIK